MKNKNIHQFNRLIYICAVITAWNCSVIEAFLSRTETYIYGSPKEDDGTIKCRSCVHKDECCPNAHCGGRIVNVSFHLLPHIDTNDPPMSKRFKSIMKKRPSVERMIKRLKCDLGDDRLTKRGHSAFQAYLDKTTIAYQIFKFY